MSALAGGEWCDLWIIAEQAAVSARLTRRPGAPLMVVPYAETAALHRAVVEQREDRDAFVARWEDGLYRVKRFLSGRDSGKETYNIRRLPRQVPSIEQTALPQPLAQRLIDLGGRKGMIIVTGRVGVGKTWTAGAIFSTWLRQYGGAGVAIEDPPELPLDGPWGDGYCWQWERAENELGAAVMESLRSGMRYVFIGEIRSEGSAREAINAATAGYSVIFCLHAGSPIEGAQRLLHLASTVSQEESVASMIAEGLVALLHIDAVRGDDGAERPLIKALFGTPAVARLIRARQFEHLRGEMDTQAAKKWRELE